MMLFYRTLLGVSFAVLVVFIVLTIEVTEARAIQLNADNIQQSLGASEGKEVSPESLLYFNQTPPALIPKVFAPELISRSDRGEFASVFSADGTEIIFGVGNGRTTEIHSARLINDSWSEPRTVIGHERYSYMDAFLSPDETRLYYISNQPFDGLGAPKDPDLWFSDRTNNGWGEPQNAGPTQLRAG